MHAQALRHFFAYHFAENRKIWDAYIAPLSLEQFTQAANYSQGSVCEQIRHLIGVDEAWFGDLGAKIPELVAAAEPDERPRLRAHWDHVEQGMRDYLAQLRDEQLAEKPLQGEDKDLRLWQVLLHVVNHGTDHRAQLLRLLNDLGVKTKSQDYIFYVYENGAVD